MPKVTKYNSSLHLRIDAVLLAWAKAMAAQKDVTLSKFLRDVISKELKDRGQ